MFQNKLNFYDDSNLFLESAAKDIQTVDVVLDIGPGIRPQNFFRPLLHLMIEPCKEYSQILCYKNQNDKSVIIFNERAENLLSAFSDNSIDTIFLIDVLEHFEKNVGMGILKHCNRIARKQIVIFTPLGYLPQYVEPNETDAWGLNGSIYQEHLSGWIPEEFIENDWKFHICETFHTVDNYGKPFDFPYGAMFAIKTYTSSKYISIPKHFKELQNLLPSEVELQQIKSEMEIQQTQFEMKIQQIQSKLDAANHALNHPLIRLPRKIWHTIKFWK